MSTVRCSKNVFMNSQGTSQKMDSNHSQVPKDLIMDLSTIKRLFIERGIEEKLTHTISPANKLQWRPDWNKSTSQTINDSTHYVFVPLQPYMITAEGEKAGKTVNTSNYLIIKNDNEYYFGTYESAKKLVSGPKSAEDYDGNLKQFTGRFIMINFHSRKSISVDYENGVVKKK